MLRLLVASLALAAAGCASSRLVQPEQVTQPTRLEAVSAERGKLRVTVEGLITPDSPGSWTRQAHWDEYRLRFANVGGEPLTLEGVSLASLLPQASLHTTSLEDLRSSGRENARWLASTAGAAATAGVAAFATSGLLFLTGQLAASITAFAAIGPAAAAGGVVYAVARSQRDNEDNRLIQETLQARGLRTPTRLAPGQVLSASAFFGATPGPKRLDVAYTDAHARHVASVSVEALAGLAAVACGWPEAIEHPEPVASQGPLFVVEDTRLVARLDRAILRNGRGSSIVDAYWDEYRFDIRARDKPVKVNMVLVSDPAGRRFPAQVPRCTPPEELTPAERAALSTLSIVGAAMAGTRDFERARVIGLADRIEAWRTPLPAAIAPGESARLRLFFPAIAQPVQIEIRYDDGQEERSLVIDAREALAPWTADAHPLRVRQVPAQLPRIADQPGFVRARLTLDAVGRVEWIEILDSQPGGMYDAAARTAFSRWRYVPGAPNRTAEARIDFKPGGEP